MKRLLGIIAEYWIGTITIIFAIACVYALWRTL